MNANTFITGPRWADSGQPGYDMTVGRGHVQPTRIHDLAVTAGATFDVEGHTLDLHGAPLLTAKGEPWKVAHVRTDTGEVLHVHDGTHSVRNYAAVLDELEATFPETCTKVSVLDGGRKLMTQHQIGESLDLPGGDKLMPTIIGVASLDSTWATQVRSFAHVLSCSNMLGHTTRHVSVRATKNHNSLLNDKMVAMAMAMDHARTYARIARISSDMEFTDSQFKEMVENLPQLAGFKARAEAPRYNDEGVLVPQHRKTINSWENRRDALMENWGKEKELKGGSHKWAAFNAVQGAEQHTISVGFGTSAKAKASRPERLLTQLVASERILEKQAFEYLRFDELVGA